MKGIVNSMAKKIITEVEMLTLKELETDDYQHGESYSGEPLSIKVDINDDVLNLKFFFQNTDEDIAEDWVNEFLTTNEFDIQSYELFSKGGEHSLVVASFARTEAGTEVDYSFTDEEIASLNIQEDSELPNTQQASTNTSNTFTTSVSNMSANTSTNSSQPRQKRAYKRKTVTTVLPATAASKQIALNLSGSGLSIKGQSNRVSTLDDQGQKVSAAKQIQAYIDAALPKLTAKEMTILTDAIQCKARASLGYPLFMEVNPALTYKVQATFNGRYRYGKQILTIQGKNYYVTNHLFARNISKVKDLFTALGLLSPTQNTSTTVSTASNVNSLINQSVQGNQSVQSNQSTNILSDDNVSDNSNQQGANISSNNVDVLSSETKVMSDKEFFERSAQLLDDNDAKESISKSSKSSESNENINVQSTNEIATDIVNTLEKEQKQIEQDEQVIQDNWELDASSNNGQQSTIVNVDLNVNEQDEVNEVEK